MDEPDEVELSASDVALLDGGVVTDDEQTEPVVYHPSAEQGWADATEPERAGILAMADLRAKLGVELSGEAVVALGKSLARQVLAAISPAEDDGEGG